MYKIAPDVYFVQERYGLSSSPTVQPETWYKEPPEVTREYPYLWKKEKMVDAMGKPVRVPPSIIKVYDSDPPIDPTSTELNQ